MRRLMPNPEKANTEKEDQLGQAIEIHYELDGYYVAAKIQTPNYPYNGTSISFSEETGCISIDPRYDGGYSGWQITMDAEELLYELDIPSEILEKAARRQFKSLANHQAVLDAADTVAQLRLEGKTDGMDEALDSLLDAVLKNR